MSVVVLNAASLIGILSGIGVSAFGYAEGAAAVEPVEDGIIGVTPTQGR